MVSEGKYFKVVQKDRLVLVLVYCVYCALLISLVPFFLLQADSHHNSLFAHLISTNVLYLMPSAAIAMIIIAYALRFSHRH